MNNNKLKEFFTDLMVNPEKFDSLGELTSESLDLLESVILHMQKGTEKEKLELQKTINEINDEINSSLNSLAGKTGLDRTEFDQIMHDPRAYSQSDWEALQAFKGKIAEKQEEFNISTSKKEILRKSKKTKKGQKSKKAWLSA